jgi:hypothetical protein
MDASISLQPYLLNEMIPQEATQSRINNSKKIKLAANRKGNEKGKFYKSCYGN